MKDFAPAAVVALVAQALLFARLESRGVRHEIIAWASTIFYVVGGILILLRGVLAL